MKRSWKITLALVAAAALGMGMSTAARATGIGMGPGGSCAMAGMGMADPERMSRHLAMMKKDLNISPAQEAAWAAFAQSAQQQKTAMMSAMQNRMQQTGDARSAPERVGERLRLMQQRVAGMEVLTVALNRLYAVLTPGQREILDSRMGRMPV